MIFEEHTVSTTTGKEEMYIREYLIKREQAQIF